MKVNVKVKVKVKVKVNQCEASFVAYPGWKAPVSNNEANARLAEELYYAQENMYEDEEDGEEGGEGGTKNPAVTRDGKMTKVGRCKAELGCTHGFER